MEDRWSPLLPPDDPKTVQRDYVARTKVQRWKGTGWHFASLSPTQSALIRKRFGSRARGWGSLRVRVKVGDTEWLTSLFPVRKSGIYVFAVKGPVRKAEDLGHGDAFTARIHVL